MMDTTYIKMADCEEIQSSGFRPDILNSAIDYPFGISSQGDLSYLKKNRWLWLPLQGQLQEMLRQECPLELLNRFYRWINETDIAGFDASMEQLWMAFAMKELHQKQWTGDKWVTESP